MAQTNTNQWTTRKLLEWMSKHFEDHSIDSPRLISEMLLTHLFGGERIDLYANVDRIATDEERDSLRSFVKRTVDHEPVQYIVGKTWFNGMEFNVDSSTLIPRTCTEVIVEQAIEYAQRFDTSPIRIADIGTGTGCIAITIAANIDANVTATDISHDALALAAKNAKQHGVTEKISFLHGDGLDPISALPYFHILCSNPPYIPNEEMEKLDKNVREWEPELALAGGADGLEIIRPLVQNGANHLVSGGVLLIEIASSIKNEVLKLAMDNTLLKDAKILRDRHGDDRFLRAIKC